MCMLQVRERERRRWRPCGRRSGDAGARRFLRLAQRHKTSSVTRIRVDRKEFILLSRETRRLRLSRMSSRRGGRKNPHRSGVSSLQTRVHTHRTPPPVPSVRPCARRIGVPYPSRAKHDTPVRMPFAFKSPRSTCFPLSIPLVKTATQIVCSQRAILFARCNTCEEQPRKPGRAGDGTCWRVVSPGSGRRSGKGRRKRRRKKRSRGRAAEEPR